MTQIPYGKDYYAWVNQQTELLRKGESAKIDWENVLEEFQSLADIEYRNFKDSFYFLIGNLLIWQWHHPINKQEEHELDVKILDFRLSVNNTLRDSLSLKAEFLDNPEWFQESWQFGRMQFSIITDADNSTCPEIPVWSAEQILDYDFYPEIKQYG